MIPPRHILILIHSLGGGGAERVTLDLAGNWAANGNRVTILTMMGDASAVYGLPPGVRHLPLGLAGASRGAVAALVANIRRLRALRRRLQDEAPDIVLGMMVSSATLLGLLRNRQYVAIGAEHNYPPRDAVSRPWQVLRRLAYGRLDAVTALTSEGRDWLLAHTRAQRVAVIPNAIHLPLERRDPILPPAAYRRPGRRLLLAVGRLAPQKGFDRLLTAFAGLAAAHPDWDLCILGEGVLRPDLEAQRAQAGLGDRVLLPGWAGNLAEWYGAADLFVLSSRYEGFGNVLVEAMAHGCPPVSVDCDTGPRDIIRDGLDGLLVAPDDPAALRDGLDRLMRDERLRAELAARAPEAAEKFAPARIAALWEDVFAGAAGRRPEENP